MAKVIQFMRDGLRNVLSGLGTSSDKSVAATWNLYIPSRIEIEACYRGTWLGRKIHDIPAKDMTREWRGWQAEDDQIEAIENEEKRLQLRARVKRALILSRLYGGAALILGLPGSPSEPAPAKIGKGALRYVHVVNRHQLTLGDEDRDLRSDTFGGPVNYQLQFGLDGQSNSVPIHPSRVVPFVGAQIPDGSFGGEQESWFWGDPLLATLRDALLSNDTATASITALLNEAKIDIVHIPGLMDHLANSEYEGRLIERFNIAALIKSITNVLMLDGGDGTEAVPGEKWEQRQIVWEGLPDVARTLFQMVSGAADIPATRLLGQAPVGMNATGDSDTRNYYDMLASEQESELTPALYSADEYLIQSALGSRDPAIFYEWNELWQLPPEEKAKRDKTVAETANIYAMMGSVPDDALAVAVQNRLIEDGVFPGLEAALEEAEKLSALEAPDEPEPAVDPNNPEAGAIAPAAGQGTPATRRPKLGQGRGSAVTQMSGNSRRRAANDRARRAIQDSRSPGRLDVLELTDAKPRTLYVRRDVLNSGDIETWARKQGFTALVPDMHVTIAFSTTPVDWLKMGDNWSGDPKGNLEIKPGGPRLVEPLGTEGAVVLMFGSSELSWRHEDMKRNGASWDYDEFQPHVTITYEKGDIDLDAVEPYRGVIRLGPEIFEEVNPGRIPTASE